MNTTIAAIKDSFVFVIKDHDLHAPMLLGSIANPDIVHRRTYRSTIPWDATAVCLTKKHSIVPDGLQAGNELRAKDADINVAVCPCLFAQKQFDGMTATQCPIDEVTEVRL